MELLLARSADHLGEGVVGAMDDTEADHTVFHTSKVLVQVVLPQQEAVQQ